jgi:3D (Asp-Asp-Asp) domain-containing protein
MSTGSQRNKARRRIITAFIALWLVNITFLPLLYPMKDLGVAAQGIRSCSSILPIDGTMFAVTVGNRTPGVINSARFISGLTSGENIVGIDFRPANGQLYAISSFGRAFIINTTSGFATVIGAAPLNPALSGGSFGVDFNPVPDRIRIVSDADQNLRVNPNNGVVAGVDGALAYAAADANAGQDPNVVAAAYTNNFAGSTSTTLYGIDSNLDTLVTQGSSGGSPVSPNSGQLFTVGALNVDTTDLVGFDIAPISNAAFVSLTLQGAAASQLNTINLANGATTPVGAIGGGQLIRDIAFAARAENIFAITDNNVLLSFTSGVPGVINSSRAVSGLASGEEIVGIDFRPATGQLYAATNVNRVYIINPASGTATAVGAGPLNPGLSGLTFGFDFNPVPDRIRVVSDAGQNLRLNPNNGAVAGVDGALAYAAADANAGQDPNVVAAAYTNNFVGATSTTLYVIDSLRDTLAIQGSSGGSPVSPNTGQLFTVGSLGVDPNNIAGFDISSSTGAAFASLNIGGSLTTQLYGINLTTGAASLIGAIGGDNTIRDIAVEIRTPNIFAVTASNVLISFSAGTPGVINTARAILGLSGNETILGLDFRPATGQLYALTNANRVYLINPANAAAAPVNISALNPALNGLNFGVDFNPVPDRIRVVSDAGQNLRLNPNNGAVAGVDGALSFAPTDANAGAAPNIIAAAYTNSFLGATSTTLYGIDSNLGALVIQGSIGGAPVSPNTGQLFTVGSLGTSTTGMVGFDIAPMSNAAYVSLSATGAATSQLFAVNLMNGAATLIGAIGVDDQVRAIAVGSAARTTNFDTCIQDDRSGDILQFNSCTGDYQFMRCGAGGFTLIGRGRISRADNFLNLSDPKVNASIENKPFGSRKSGSAVIRPLGVGPAITIEDSGTTNNTCSCR